MSRVIHVVGAAIIRDARCLVARRGPRMSPPRRVWEFPGGKVEPGESPQVALAREIEEELGVSIAVEDLVGTSHVTTADGRHIRLDVHLARLVGGEVRPVEHDAVRWLAHDELESLSWAEADVPLLPAVQAQLWWLAERG